MIRRWLAALTAAALCAALPALGAGSALAAAPAAPAPVATAEKTSTQVDDFRACVAGGGATDILLLVDESSSLQGTDPENARVTSASYLVKQLADFATGSKADLSVAVSVFAQGYSRIDDWTSLDNTTLPGVQATIASLKDRVQGMETDYWTALDGARTELAARAAARPGTQSCQTLVWFTDGAINYTIRQSNEDKALFGAAKPFAPDVELTSQAAVEQVRQLAVSDICRGGGLADQLRSSHVSVFGVGLQSGEPSDFSFLESVVAGKSTSDSSECGKLTAPIPGEFHLATDIDGLLFAFDGVSSPKSRAILQTSGICQVAVCADSAHRFVLDQSTPAVRVLATADAPGISASLLDPLGHLSQLPRTNVGTEVTLAADGSSLKYTWLSEKTVVISMAAGAGSKSWSGLWQLAFTDPAGQSGGKPSRSSIHIEGSLKPAWLNPAASPLHVGEKIGNIQLGLLDAAGNPVDPGSLLGDVKLTASLVGSEGKTMVVADALGKADIAKPVTLDLTGFSVGAAELKLDLAITTAPTTAGGNPVPGTALTPALASVPVNLLPPAEFPVVGSKIDFGQMDGTSQASAALQVSGAGCVWLAAGKSPDIVASPAALGKVTIGLAKASGPESCIKVKDVNSLPMTFAADQPDNGSVNGRIELMIAPDGEPGRALPVSVAFTASMSKPLNTTNFLLALIVALVLGPGIPLLLMYGAKWFVARIPGRVLSGEIIPVTISHQQLLRDGQPFVIRDTDLTDLVPMKASGSRSLTVAGIELRAKTGWSPLGSGYVAVLAPARYGVGSAAPAADRRGLTPRLPLAVHNHWVLLVDPMGDPASASVLVLTAGDASPAEKKDIAADIARRLPLLRERLAEAMRAADVAEATTPGQVPGSGPTASGGAGGFSGFSAANRGAGPGGFSGFGGASPDQAPVPEPASGSQDPQVTSPWGTPPP
ncbi:vWA domain-containing protein [Arthrobacter sp. PAMC25564]|uniref:vWA domain-containing protein n=1 Tax=Arthrobacter sp. PAMC25564 TaxID=2565366 RepID=UPI00144542FD|nr:vWA domain-containing protein [Arthrobacter sp. PAMC25564]